eukprot:TRINITY_DN2220_c0_g1_i2.p1 TRINITY_DN2220_c0_g1~~TRINITY_DN2220_c0_g1_i2.p1  ORF type:complete len:631 (-),score=83.45 TRINITY_DN2220_c0_g1_i2:404-2296(-)
MSAGPDADLLHASLSEVYQAHAARSRAQCFVECPPPRLEEAVEQEIRNVKELFSRQLLDLRQDLESRILAIETQISAREAFAYPRKEVDYGERQEQACISRRAHKSTSLSEAASRLFARRPGADEIGASSLLHQPENASDESFCERSPLLTRASENLGGCSDRNAISPSTRTKSSDQGSGPTTASDWACNGIPPGLSSMRYAHRLGVLRSVPEVCENEAKISMPSSRRSADSSTAPSAMREDVLQADCATLIAHSSSSDFDEAGLLEDYEGSSSTSHPLARAVSNSSMVEVPPSALSSEGMAANDISSVNAQAPLPPAGNVASKAKEGTTIVCSPVAGPTTTDEAREGGSGIVGSSAAGLVAEEIAAVTAEALPALATGAADGQAAQQQGSNPSPSVNAACSASTSSRGSVQKVRCANESSSPAVSPASTAGAMNSPRAPVSGSLVATPRGEHNMGTNATPSSSSSQPAVGSNFSSLSPYVPMMSGVRAGITGIPLGVVISGSGTPGVAGQGAALIPRRAAVVPPAHAVAIPTAQPVTPCSSRGSTPASTPILPCGTPQGAVGTWSPPRSATPAGTPVGTPCGTPVLAAGSTLRVPPMRLSTPGFGSSRQQGCLAMAATVQIPAASQRSF